MCQQCNNNHFTHLHVHSEASNDGLRPVKELVKQAAKSGATSLALTDHATLLNAITFTKECESRNIKPILGYEGYISFEGEIGHITLLSDGNTGWNNLIKLGNKAHRSSFKFPAFTIDELLEHNQGLVVLSGCMASPFHRMQEADSKALAAKFKSVFEDRFFIEVMTVNDDRGLWEKMLKLSHDLNIPSVLTNDVHFVYRDDYKIHPTLTQIRAGFDYSSKNLWLMARSDIEQRIRELNMPLSMFSDSIDMSYTIGEKLSKVNLKNNPTLPHWPNAMSELTQICNNSLDRYISKNSPMYNDYDNRLKYELSIIQQCGFETYFMILQDVINYAKSNKIRVGEGRGSGAGSLVLFFLGITGIDPIQYNLSFERFLNPERIGFPDVDTDFSSSGRDEIIEYVNKKWGAYPVVTVSTFSHKSLVHDLCRQFNVFDKKSEEKVADFGNTDSDGNYSDEFKQLPEYQSIIKVAPLVDYAYDAMLGQIRHRGKHAGGFIITEVPVPFERAGDKIVAAWTEASNDQQNLSYAGIVKYDFLALTALDILDKLEKSFGFKAEEPYEDSPVFRLFQSGDTFGIFQFAGSSGIIEMTKRVQPNKLEDLVAITALYRPGALGSGAALHFPEFRQEPRKIHPLVDDILEPTYGIIVYQEQFMNIYARMVSGSLGQADLARRVISKAKIGDKQWELDVMQLQENFINGGLSQGVDIKILNMLWSEIITHTRYSFNRAHSVCYAKLAYETAWWKYYHPVAFYAELLNSDSGEAATYLFDVALRGIKIVPPHVNHSSFEYEYDEDENTIFMPLNSVKFLGENAAKVIIAAREMSGEFQSLSDFVNRIPTKIVNSRAREALFALGSFNGIAGSEKELKLKNEVDVTKWQDNQQKFLGFVLPNESVIEFVQKNTKGNQYAGMITTKKDKNSRYDGAPFSSYRLMPEKGCWSREFRNLEVGDIVLLTVSDKNGRIMKASKVRLQ